MTETQISSKLSPSKSDEASPINYARIVILRNRGVGKTALIKVIIWRINLIILNSYISATSFKLLQPGLQTNKDQRGIFPQLCL